jgi:hypothetical protein
MKPEYYGAILEDIQRKFDTVLEIIIPDIQSMKRAIIDIQADIADMKAQLATDRARLKDHEARITTLEAA